MSNTGKTYTWSTSIIPVCERMARALERIADVLESKVVINGDQFVENDLADRKDESPKCICDEMRFGGVTYWDCPKCGHIERGFEIIPGSE